MKNKDYITKQTLQNVYKKKKKNVNRRVMLSEKGSQCICEKYRPMPAVRSQSGTFLYDTIIFSAR